MFSDGPVSLEDVLSMRGKAINIRTGTTPTATPTTATAHSITGINTVSKELMYD